MNKKECAKFSFTRNNFLILKTITTYTKTTSGKNWKKNPDDVEREIISPEHYTNYITSIPFFNNFGDGAYCRASEEYTEAGFLPVTVTSVSPYRAIKKIATFRFIPKSDLLLNAAWRESEIVNNARTFSTEYVNGHEIITLYTDLDGVTSSGDYDNFNHTWRG